ncbi:hypothetical protein NHX12_014970 [Muraenolepis orangiensis]|uniref:Uncharacterized protein n=1 Tax=Muraenolepis orangiensis TaxID=630683 RepID=A0A9Q0D9J9_9TELE|nr:hypothetical protein NHX12_014970 [Muraenolepis orangiensis]
MGSPLPQKRLDGRKCGQRFGRQDEEQGLKKSLNISSVLMLGRGGGSGWDAALQIIPSKWSTNRLVCSATEVLETGRDDSPSKES